MNWSLIIPIAIVIVFMLGGFWVIGSVKELALYSKDGKA